MKCHNYRSTLPHVSGTSSMKCANQLALVDDMVLYYSTLLKLGSCTGHKLEKVDLLVSKSLRLLGGGKGKGGEWKPSSLRKFQT